LAQELKIINGVGDVTAERVLQEVLGSPEPHKNLIKLDSPKSTDFLRFKQLLNDLFKNRDTLSPADLLAKVSDYYEPILKVKYDDSSQRSRDIMHLLGISNRYRSLNSFINDISIEPQDRFADTSEDADLDDEKLTISTIHSAKGLEWQVVYVIWLLESRFPSSFSMMKDEELEEERRLFYVSVTRAKDQLYLTLSGIYI
jgi:DNA helicase-2/ATP-dependent DNA helicase PcrA